MKPRIRACAFLGVALLVGLCEGQAGAADWPMLGRDNTRNAVSPESHPPLDWAVGRFDRKSGEWINYLAQNIKWTAPLGSMTFGTPVVAGGQVYIGTNNSAGHLKRYPADVDLGCLLCFRESDGEFLWQFSAEKLPIGRVHDWPLYGISATPLVEGNRMWFVSNRSELVCLDTEGFHDGEDDGPEKAGWGRLFIVARRDRPSFFDEVDRLQESLDGLERGVLTDWLRGEFECAGVPMESAAMPALAEDGPHWKMTAQVGGVRRRFSLRKEEGKLAVYKLIAPDDKREADVVWRYDLVKELGVYPRSVFSRNMRCSPSASYRNRIYIVTGHGVHESRIRIPAPEAPSLVCFDKDTGKVLWTDASPGENILDIQVSSPLVVEIGGRAQVVVGQGDGWVRSFDALTGKRIWEFDINPKESKWERDGRGTRNSIIATPVYYDGRVYIGSGQHLEHGGGEARLVCIDPTKTGDISSELAVDAEGHALPRRRVQAAVPEKGEKAIPNPNSGLIWEYTAFDWNRNGKIDFEEAFHPTVSRVAIKNGLVIAPDSSGIVHCFDARTGQRHWTYDALADLAASPLIVDDWVYVPDEDGDVALFRLSSDPNVAMKNVDGEYRPRIEINMDNSVFSSPMFANGVLYIATNYHLWAIAAPDDKQKRE